jgi:hypothetical protein
VIAVRSKQRIVRVCFVVGLGLASGAINYASSEDEKTLAGDASEFVQVFGCSQDYPTPVEASTVKGGVLIDENGDGTICSNGAGGFEDNEYISNGDDVRLMANGHGNFFDNAKFVDPSKAVEGKVQDLSFSFHGIERGSEGSARGEFEYHDQTGDGPDLTVHGNVLCLAVDPLSLVATFIGQVTRSNDKKLLVGKYVGWQAQDNGEGELFTADLVTRLYEVPGSGCKQKFKVAIPTMRGILSGNIQVHY